MHEPLTAPAREVIGLTVAAVIVVMLAGAIGYTWGGEDGRAELARINALHATALATATDRVARIDRDTRDQLAAIDSQRQQEQKHAAEDRDRLLASLRTGALRMSIPARCAPGAAAVAADTGARNPAPRAELEPEAAATLAAIAADGDAAILDLNACIDSYAAARAAVMQQDR